MGCCPGLPDTTPPSLKETKPSAAAGRRSFQKRISPMGALLLCYKSIDLLFLCPAVCQDLLLSFSAAVRFFHEAGFSVKGGTFRPVHESGPGRRCGREHL